MTDTANFENQSTVEKMKKIELEDSDYDENFVSLITILKVVIKGHKDKLNFIKIKASYQKFEISESNFDEILKSTRRAIVISKQIKNITLLRDIMQQMSDLRSHVECTNNINNDESN